MEPQKAKSIKSVGLVIAIFSGLIIFSNGMGALVFTLLGFGGTPQNIEPIEMNLLDILFDNIALFLLALVIFGVSYLFGGIYLSKYKLWAKNLLLITSYIFLILLWVLTGTSIYYTINESGLEFFAVLILIMALVFTFPLIFLVRFLSINKMHFN